MKRKALAAVSAAALVCASPLLGQRDSVRQMRHGHGEHCTGPNCPAMQMRMGQEHGQGMGMMGMMGMQGPMARAMAFAPDRLLEHRAQLGLTDQQAARLTALRDAAKTAHDAHHAQAMKYMDELATVAASGDTAAVRGPFMGHHQSMGSAHWTMLRTAVQARGILTDVQRARVDGWVDAMGRQRQ